MTLRGVALLGRAEFTGDAYKYVEMLSRLLDFEVVYGKPEQLAEYMAGRTFDYAIVRGDHRTTYQLALKAGIPYLLLEGDVNGMVYGPSAEEKEMLENAAGIIFNCEGTRDWCDANYKLPKNVEVVYLRPLAEQLSFRPLPKLPGKTLCYAGGLQSPERSDMAVGYRSLHDIFGGFMAEGWAVHVYCQPMMNPRIRESYIEVGVTTHMFVPERELPRVLSKYTAGFQGFNMDGSTPEGRAYCDIAKPNKAWLYLAAGIPTIGLNPGREAAAIYDGKWGVVIDSPHSRIELPPIDESVRRREVMDNDLDAFRRLSCAVSLG